MNKLLLLLFAVAFISCSVEEVENENAVINRADLMAADYGCAGPDNSITKTPEFVDENLYTAARIKRFYLDLLADGVSREGTFNPTINELASMYMDSPIGDFTTTYTVNNTDCEDSAVLTLTVAEASDEPCEEIAGSDQTRTVTAKYVEEELYTAARVKRFFLNTLDDGVSEDGTFNPTINEIIADYLENGLGSYTTTYTVEEGVCTDSADLTIVIEEACTVNAGSDATATISPKFVEEELDTDAKIDRFFLDLLDDGVSEEGMFSPTIQEIKMDYIENGPGTYSTTYTLGEGSCQDSAEITLIIEDECDIDAGADNYVTVTQNYVQNNLYTGARLKRFYLNLLDSGVSKDGTFNPTISEIASSYRESPIGEFTTTYTVGSGDCTDTVDLTVNVIE